MEIWDLYDENGALTGETMVRGEKWPEGKYHLVVHVCVFNQKGEMVIQQRQPFKQGWSNMWDITVGGSAVEGENGRQAAMREVGEEIGLTIDLEGVRPHIRLSLTHCIDEIFLVEKEVDPASLHLQYEEVQRVEWASKEKIQSMIAQGVFIPYYASFIDLLFDMKGRYGCRSVD